jgi:hypothetical protein
MVEVRQVFLRGDLGHFRELRIAEFTPGGLSLLVGREEIHASGLDLFESLTQLRLALEERRLLLCVQGSCSDVYPSGMSRQMSNGRLAYRHVAGRLPDASDLVDIFDSAEEAAVVSVEDQLTAISALRALR